MFLLTRFLNEKENLAVVLREKNKNKLAHIAQVSENQNTSECPQYVYVRVTDAESSYSSICKNEH